VNLQTTAGLVSEFYISAPYEIIIRESISEEDTFSPDENDIVWPSWIELEIAPPVWQPSVSISALHDLRLRLQQQITVSLEYDGYQFIAYAPDLDIYGTGDTEYEAIEDLRQSIVELYFDLKGEKLALSLRKIWDYLNSIVEEIESPRSQESI